MNQEEAEFLQKLKDYFEKELNLQLSDTDLLECYKNLILFGKALHEYYLLKADKS